MKPLPQHTVHFFPLKMRLPSHFGHKWRGSLVIIEFMRRPVS